ncbi:uncharacterized protein F4807DRAFT_468906 [Annulohypoxylon truncatum]|uniref:uncharacterized protein n=1 Tax=Annulohypoxylon truncatum TaxID=327061 RepID=UPI0020082FE2|nr:uncharacterized protein F4807DRAFT_468906 [Annulohypoxylon truncatum]KAI1208030.1 hypothetical protein F4807DRAFT_468906 [Annulohypoxylon truncatum]
MSNLANYQRIENFSEVNLPIDSEHDHRAPVKAFDRRRYGARISTAYWLVVIFAASLVTALPVGILCFRWGRHMQEIHQTQLNWFPPPGHLHTVFRRQALFALRPDNISEALWTSLFPRGDGFIKHPELSPEPTCLAVYHQLHCLDAIRSGYWAAIDGIEPNHHARPAHVRHCIDYLRQSLMCHADTNLESINPDLGGVTGFDSERTCRNYDRVTAWADRWRARD